MDLPKPSLVGRGLSIFRLPGSPGSSLLLVSLGVTPGLRSF